LRWLRSIPAHYLLLALCIAILAALASGLWTLSSSAATLIHYECDLFYGPVGPDSVAECLVEMSRRHFLPTIDQSTLTPTVGAARSSGPANR
jgi:hypothetical protein